MSDRTPPASYPASASASATPGAAPPQQVRIAFWLYLVAAAISLISLIISLASLGSLKSDLQKQLASQGKQVSESTLNGAVATSVTLAVVFGLLYIAAYVLFAFFMRRGANWARIVLAFVTVLSLFGVLGGFGLGAVRVVAGVIATILIFLKPANEYFATAKRNRAPRA